MQRAFFIGPLFIHNRFKQEKTMQKLTYSTLFVIGAFSAFWIFSPNNQDTSQESSNGIKTQMITSETLTSPLNTNNSLHIDISVADDVYCNNRCQESIDLLRFQAEFNDDEYEILLNSSSELAVYLRDNPNIRAEFIELASTSTPNNRNIIMAAFNQLDAHSRSQLGQALIESSNWHSRFDGIIFLSKPDLMDEQLAQQLSDILPTESAYYVRNSIIKALNQPDKFYGNQDILNTLEQIGYSDDNNTVRGEALLARVQLEQNPEAIFNDAFSAIRSNQADYQEYGLRALVKIIKRQTLNESEISSEYQNEAKDLFEELLSPKYDQMPEDFHITANKLLARFVEY